MPRKQRRDDYETADTIANTIIGLILGICIGSGIGLGVCVYILPFTILFPGDTMVLGAVCCGFGGFWYGDPFIDWLSDNSWWFH